MQNNARIGGILSIVAGAFGIFSLLIMAFMIFAAASISDSALFYNDDIIHPDEFLVVVTVFYAIVAGFFALCGVMGIIGGIFAINKKNWGLALTGAITATLAFLPLSIPIGIPAIIFVSMGKQEFETGNPAQNQV